MKNSIQNIFLWLIFIVCTIYSKLIITFLVFVVIYIFYFVKLALNSHSSDQYKGEYSKNTKHQIFSREESQKDPILKFYPPFVFQSLISNVVSFFSLKNVFFFVLFSRLLFSQFHLEQDFQKIGCRQNWQEIDVSFFWSVPQNTESKILSFKTNQWIFPIKSFLTPDQKQLLLTNTTQVALHGKIQCLWPTTITPFTRESLMIARWNRGVITKIYTLTPNNKPLSYQTSTFFNLSSQIPNPQSLVPTTKTSWILRWILLWDTSNMSQDTYQLFLDSGLVHLVSASWWNILILIEIITALFFFTQIRYRKYIFAAIVALYFFIVWENLSFARAVVVFWITTFLVPTWYRRNRKTIFFTVLILFALYNPLIIITSWWLLLSASGVWWLLHIPPHFQKHKILSFILPSFFAYISLLWPLFLLTQHINLLSIPLSIIAQWLTTAIIFTSPLSFTMFTYVVQVLIDMLYHLAYRWSVYGVFIATDSHSTIIALAVRILSWLLLYISYTHFHKKHLLS